MQIDLAIGPEFLLQPSSIQQWWLSPSLTFQHLQWKWDGTNIQLMNAWTLLEESQGKLGSRSHHLPGGLGRVWVVWLHCVLGKESRGSTAKCCTWDVNQKPEQIEQQSLECIRCKRDQSLSKPCGNVDSEDIPLSDVEENFKKLQ